MRVLYTQQNSLARVSALDRVAFYKYSSSPPPPFFLIYSSPDTVDKVGFSRWSSVILIEYGSIDRVGFSSYSKVLWIL